MTFDRIAWMDRAFKVADRQSEPAVFKDRITILALLADQDGAVSTGDYESTVGQPPGALRAWWGDVIQLT